jgi:hypothetical protein
MGRNVDLASLPAGALVALAILALAEVALDAVALVDLARRPREAVAFVNKWVWLAIILVINPIGAIVYLAAGRMPTAPVDRPPAPAPTGASSTSIADALYGERDRKDNG